MSSLLDWPTFAERTPAEERQSARKFNVNWNRAKRDLDKEMERLDVDNYRIDSVTGGGDPAVAVRWEQDGVEHAAACDAYSDKRANLRSIGIWIEETRKRSNRPVQTGGDEFAAAALPSGREEEPVQTEEPPHEILGLSPDVDPDVAQAAGRRLKAKYHPDSGEEPDREQYIKVSKALEAFEDGE